MVNFKTACEKVLRSEDTPSTIHTAWDFGDFYLFSLAPYGYGEKLPYDTGTIFPAIDKVTGDIYDYDITTDLGLFDNAVVIVGGKSK